MKLFTVLLALFLLPGMLTAQDSAAASAYTWQLKSVKTGPQTYRLEFRTAGLDGTTLYAPGQDLDGIASAELNLADSSIRIDSFRSATPVNAVRSALFGNRMLNLSEGPATWTANLTFSGKVPAQLLGTLTVYYNRGEEFLADLPFSFSAALEGGTASGMALRKSSIDIAHPVSSCGDEASGSQSVLRIFLLGLLGGLIALLTPCVFPMIPVTVTFFTKKSHNRGTAIRNAVMYGFFIFLIYVAITLPFHIASNTISPEIFNNISTNVWLNLIFFAVFVLFALSFFGLFEIVLPAGIANRTDSRSGLGNISGIFFMAATLAIVSFSCTGPLLGTLLANVANEGPWPLTAGAAGFGVALGLPFALFALFPNWLHSLPRSGGWMTDVKVVLGFVELALAVKFLANADNVEQWGLLKREIFVAAWILIGLCIVLYLLGWLRIGHSAPVKRFSAMRLGFIALFSAITLYLVPGLTNSPMARMGLLSGFPPPLSYSLYQNHVLIKKGVQPLHNTYEEALQRARAENKPVLIDFTGWACVNCRRMEELVWTDALVDSLMRTRFVVLSLYVDEKTKLPTAEQQLFNTAAGQAKKILTVGDRWATFQTENFGATSQPQYAIIDADEKALTKTKFYTADPAEFAAWLQCGLEAHNRR